MRSEHDDLVERARKLLRRDPERAAEMLHEALALERSCGAFFSLGILHEDARRRRLAEAAYDAAIEIAPAGPSPWPHIYRARLRMHDRRWHEAVDDLHAAERIEEEHDQFYGAGEAAILFVYLAGCCEELQDWRGSLEAYRSFQAASHKRYAYQDRIDELTKRLDSTD